MGEVRAFFAVKISEDIRGALALIMDEFRMTRADIKWVKPENLHITLKFLGNVDTGKVDDIKGAAERATDGVSPFDFRICGVDVIPNPRYPRIVYADLADGGASLKTLALRLEEELLPLGFEREDRDFLPHLTLGRVKSFRAKSLFMTRLAEFHKHEIGAMTVEAIHLMKSELHPGGATYTDMAEIPLTLGGI